MTPLNSKSVACRIITLSPESEQTQALCGELARQGIDAETFQAVDGRHAMPELLPDEHINETLALIRNGKTLTNSELGCYLSHLRAIRSIYESEKDFALMIEDDVSVEPHFGETINYLLEEQLDCIRLMALKVRKRKVLKKLPNSYCITRPERGTLGTQAYLLNRAGMRKMLDYASEIYEAIDHVIDHFYLFDLELYQLEPHIAYEKAHTSSIQKKQKDRSLKPKFWHRLAHQPVKLYFSIRRHRYLSSHKSAFYPAEFPTEWPGRSPRLRWKESGKPTLIRGQTPD